MARRPLQDGRVEDLARQHVCPMPVYVAGNLRPLAAQRDLEDTLRQVHLGLRASGASKLTVRVTAVELPGRAGFGSGATGWPSNPPAAATGRLDRRLSAPDRPGYLTEMLECSCLAPQGAAA